MVEIEYLGHIISEKGVATDSRKIRDMLDWPLPKNVKGLRGFLGLTGYYRKFIKGYSNISRPLTDLLKKNAFIWSMTAQQAFEELKQAMVKAPVLKLPDFSLPFVIETDASQTGIGAVLMQCKRPIAFLSKKLGVKNQGLSTYEKELLALYTAVTRWRHYLLGGEFIIKTDQVSLKYLLEQKINTPMQHKGMSKLLGLNYKIEYKKGSENKVADALSRRDEGTTEERGKEGVICAVSELQPQWMMEIKASYEGDEWLRGLKEKLKASEERKQDSKLSEYQGIVRYKGRICVGSMGNWRQRVLEELHSSSLGGHSGITATYQRVKQNFYWPKLKEEVHLFVQGCENCQLNKFEHVASPGLLQPLPIPEEA